MLWRIIIVWYFYYGCSKSLHTSYMHASQTVIRVWWSPLHSSHDNRLLSFILYHLHLLVRRRTVLAAASRPLFAPILGNLAWMRSDGCNFGFCERRRNALELIFRVAELYSSVICFSFIFILAKS